MGRDEAVTLREFWEGIKRPGGVPEDRKELRKHIFKTYWWLRVGMASIAGLFPLVLVILGVLLGIEWQPSMSDYYWAVPEMGGEAPMRVWFVGPLFALGTCLFLYKGYTWLEDTLLNVAAVCAICVAIFPMCSDLGCPRLSFLHYPVALGFFIFVSLVAILHGAYSWGVLWRRPGKGEENKDRGRALLYVLLAFAMPLAPFLAWRIFNAYWGEFVGIYAFCGFWLLQTRQIRYSNVDQEPTKFDVSKDH